MRLKDTVVVTALKATCGRTGGLGRRRKGCPIMARQRGAAGHGRASDGDGNGRKTVKCYRALPWPFESHAAGQYNW